MAEWLPDDFKADEMEAAASRAFDSVKARAASRRRRVRALRLSAIPAVLVAALLLIAPKLMKNSGLEAPPTVNTRATPAGETITLAKVDHSVALRWKNSGLEAPPTVNTRATPADETITLAKIDHSVAIRWKGSPENEYAVYRCTSPKFDKCSLAGVVKGTHWIDKVATPVSGENRVVYYRVRTIG